MAELQEVLALVDPDRGPATPKADVELAIQILLFHQCLYEDTPGVPRQVFELLRRQRVFFEKYFSAMGRRVIHEPREGMVALVPGEHSYGWKQARLRKDETLVLLALRLLLETGVREGRMNETGRVEATTDELHDMIRTVAAAEPPRLEGRLIDILKGCRRRGLVRIGDRDAAERVTPLTVLPGVRVLVSDAWVEALIAWCEAGAQEEQEQADDFFTFLTAYRAAATIGAQKAGAEEADDVDVYAGDQIVGGDG